MSDQWAAFWILVVSVLAGVAVTFGLAARYDATHSIEVGVAVCAGLMAFLFFLLAFVLWVKNQ